MQPNGMIFWDWNGTLMDDVDFTQATATRSGTIWPSTGSCSASPLRTTTALLGLTFPGTPTPCWQSTLWRTTMPGWTPAR